MAETPLNGKQPGEEPGAEESRVSPVYETKYNVIREKIPVRRGAYLGEEHEGESEEDVSFVVAVSDEEIYKLSPLAYYIWLLCDGKHTVNEISERMSRELGISVEETHEPLVLALETLASAHLVVFKEPG